MVDSLKAGRAAIRDFLASYAESWTLATLNPDQKAGPVARHFTDVDAAVNWAKEQNDSGLNVYFHVNPTRAGIDKKAKKADIPAVTYLHVDIDPRAGEDIAEERERIRHRLGDGRPDDVPPPTFVIDSGGGFWALWRLANPMPLNDDDDIRDAEARNLRLAQLLEGDKCQNIDRIARLPGTVNWPDAKKKAKGRVAALAHVVPDLSEPARAHDAEVFAKASAAVVSSKPATSQGPSTDIEIRNVSLADFDQWGIPTNVRSWIEHGHDPENPTRWPSRSEAVFAVTCELVRQSVPDEIIASILLCPEFGIAESVIEKGSNAQSYVLRQVEQAKIKVASGPVVISPGRPYDVAMEFRARCAPTLVWWHSTWFEYNQGAYRRMADDDIRSRVYAFLDQCKVRVKITEKEFALQKFSPEQKIVNKVIDALQARSRMGREDDMPPFWMSGDGPSPHEIVSFQNGLLHVPTEVLLPASDRFFTLSAVEFDYEASAEEPRSWLEFLDTIWGDDPDSIRLLQEIFGCLLLPDTSQQKMLLIKGPTRSGKGTIGRVLTKLIGQKNVTSPSLGSLGSDFGLEPLIVKQLAIISDMTLGKSTNMATLRENLMRISGEDMVSVNRKYKPVTDWRLSVRFLVLTNSLPRLEDASGAFANRFVPLSMTTSFLGNEDHGLTDRLSEEMSGIMRWSIDGWKRLKSRGRFSLPRSSQELLEELRKVGAPITRFVEEKCRLDAQVETPKSELYADWKEWCVSNGEYAHSHGVFCQKLLDAYSGRISTGKATLDTGREPTFRGIEPKEKIPF